MRLLALLLFFLSAPAWAYDVQTSVLVEQGVPLTLDQVRERAGQDEFRRAPSSTLSFGIGAKPVWLRLVVDNPEPTPVPLSFVAGVTWIDRLDAYLVTVGEPVRHWRSGDETADMPGLVPALGYVWPLNFPPGRSEIYLRAEAIDPLVLMVGLQTAEEVEAARRLNGYYYGFLYGVLGALFLYNLWLFVGLGERRYLYYALVLFSIILCNLGYTGHGLAWLWHGQIMLQRYIVLLLMVVYSVFGLLFASSLLALAEHAPRTLRALHWSMGIALAAIALAIAVDSHLAAALIAFQTMGAFTIVMFALGVMAVRGGHIVGRYFLAASTFGMIGAGLTVFTVWGLLPFSEAAYHGLEFGLVVEATLLALALAYQVRTQKQQGLLAERLALSDPLTGVYNRRAFTDIADRIWHGTGIGNGSLCLIMIDIDHFKAINDMNGHQAGDRVLANIAALLSSRLRGGDILARWGGEEFVLLLPETSLDHAVSIAEDLRGRIAAQCMAVRGGSIAPTASFGVAERGNHISVEDLIHAADAQLYEAKRRGRDRVSAETIVPSPSQSPNTGRWAQAAALY